MPRNLTQKEVVKRFIKVHGERYNYTKFNYEGLNTKGIVMCSLHGEFEQYPGNHMKGHGCSKCVGNHKVSKKQFIKESNLIHFEFYSYSNIVYKGKTEKIKIICPIHGEFTQKPAEHLSGCGCQKCGNKNKVINRTGKFKRKTIKEVLQKFVEVHGNKYDYSLVEYKNMNTKVTIICKEHEEFEQRPDAHIYGQGCPKCAKTSFNLLEFYKNHPKGQQLGHLYQILIYNEDECFYKVGITCGTIKGRYSGLYNETGYHYIIMEDNIMTNLESAEREDVIHKNNKHLSYNPLINFGGSTECYNERIILEVF